MITFSQGGAAKIKCKQFSEFGSRTICMVGLQTELCQAVNANRVNTNIKEIGFLHLGWEFLN